MTGAIGKATVFEFARQKQCNLIITGRNNLALAKLKDDINKVNPTIQINTLIVDLGDLNSVATVIKLITDKYRDLFGIINLAATITRDRILTKDSLETMFATNYVGPFYLTTALCDHYATRNPIKVITVSSASSSAVNFHNLQGEKKFSSIRNFSQSKACNVLFVKKLARQLERINSISIGFDPGIVKSKAMDDMPKLFSIIGKIVGSSPDQAAQSLVRLMEATNNSDNGIFFNKKLKMLKSSPLENVAAQDKLWNLTIDIIKNHESYSKK